MVNHSSNCPDETGIGVGVGIGVDEGVGLGYGVGVIVGVGIGVDVGVGVIVGVGVGVARMKEISGKDCWFPSIKSITSGGNSALEVIVNICCMIDSIR